MTDRLGSSVFELGQPPPLEEDDASAEEVFFFEEDEEVESLPTTTSSSSNANRTTTSLEVGIARGLANRIEPVLKETTSWISSCSTPFSGLPKQNFFGSVTKTPALSSSLITEATESTTVMSMSLEQQSSECDASVGVPHEVMSHPVVHYELEDDDDDELENLPSFMAYPFEGETLYTDDDNYDGCYYATQTTRLQTPPRLPSGIHLMQQTQHWGALVNDHRVRQLEQEKGALQKQVSTLHDDWNLSKQSAVEFEQENALLRRQIQRLEAQLQESAQEIIKAERGQSQIKAEWTKEADALRTDLGNTKRHLEVLKFAYETSRGTHDMDLDICGDHVWALSDHVSKQRAVIARLTEENKRLKKAAMTTSSCKIMEEDSDSSPRQEYPQCRTCQAAASNTQPTEASPSSSKFAGETRLVAEKAELQTRLDAAHDKLANLETALEQQVQETEQLQKEKAELICNQTKSQEKIVTLEGELLASRLEIESSTSKLSNRSEELEATNRQFKEENQHLRDNIVDLEAKLLNANPGETHQAAGTSEDHAFSSDKSSQHTGNASVDTNLLEPTSEANLEASPGAQHANEIDRPASPESSSGEKVELLEDKRARLEDKVKTKLSLVYKNLQLSFRGVEDDNECLRDRIADLETETRIKEQRLDYDNECLRQRIVDLEEQNRRTEQLLKGTQLYDETKRLKKENACLSERIVDQEEQFQKILIGSSSLLLSSASFTQDF